MRHEDNVSNGEEAERMMANDNILRLGLPRVGWLYDGDENTPHIGVSLSDSDDHGIQLTIPLRDVTDAYSRWFQKGAFGLVVNGAPVEPTDVPPVLQFHDSFGPVVLVGCRAAGWHSDFQVATGRIVATYAVLGARNLNYARLNGVRTVIPHLAAWMGARITTKELRTDPQGRVAGLDVSTNSLDPVRVHRKGNLTLQGSFRTSSELGPDTTLIYDQMRAETYWVEARTWDAHLDLHEAILELLTVAAWQDFGFKTLEVRRDDDPHEHHNGPMPRWSHVATHNVPRPKEDTRLPNYLFNFQDIGLPGIRKWMRLRQTHTRAIRPFVRLRGLRTANVESQLVQSSIALEALGRHLAQPSDFNSRGQLDFRKALERVQAGLGFDAVTDPDEWIDTTTTVYRGVKHPDNPQPDVLDMVNALRDNIVMLRAWVAIQLGTKRSVLIDRLRRDRQASATFEKTEW
jgi:hypothetical protein